MFVIVVTDGDADYTEVYGPFATEAEADAFDLPYDDGDLFWRVVPVESATAMQKRLQELEH